MTTSTSTIGYYWFLLNQRQVERLASQAVVPILNNARLRELNFSHPSLLEQKRLAAILAKADRLRRLRRFGLTVSDTQVLQLSIDELERSLLSLRKPFTVAHKLYETNIYKYFENAPGSL